MTSNPPAGGVPPVEPVPVVDPYAAVPPPPPASYAAPSYATAYQAGYYAAPQLPKGLAIASMVTGIVGVFFSFGYGLGLLPSIAAVITGHLARKRQPYARGMWLTGLICGYVGIGISLLAIIGIIFFIVFIATNPAYNSGDYSLN